MDFFKLVHIDQPEGSSDQSNPDNVTEASQAIELKSIARTYNQDVDGDHPENSTLGYLKGEKVHNTDAVEVEKSLQAKGLWGAITPRERPATGLENRDGEKARALILQNMSTVEAKNLSHLASASDTWKQLKSGAAYCPTCLDLARGFSKESPVRISAYKRSALGGCESCRLLLDAVVAYAPGWIGDTVEKPPVFRNKAEAEVEKSISLEISEYVLRVTLLRRDGLDLQETCFDIFNQTDMPNSLATSQHARSAIYCSPSYIHLASDWLKECVEEHSICKIPDSNFMPNRLVDVGLDTCEPFLVDSKMVPGPYVVLSYCWGTVQNTVTTTRENIADHRRCIPLLSLPRTLQDAITVCREMNVRYLWIDALCIVQNDIDEQDWYAESGKMSKIYANALFSIAADVSEDCTHGFLGKQSGSARWKRFSHSHNIGATPGIGFIRKATTYKHQNARALTESALSKRGWALQESILPSRILHFTAEEIVWECNNHCQCECGHPDYYFVKLVSRGITTTSRMPTSAVSYGYEDEDDSSRHINHFLSRRTSQATYWAWQTIVEYYTQRQLTNHADKLSALSGLARLIVDSLRVDPGGYLAGLWRGELAQGLLWHVKGPSVPRRYAEYCAPSWSWASILGGVKYFAEYYQFRFEEDVIILETSCEVSPLDPTGRVKSGYIVLSGRIEAVKLLVKHAVSGTSKYVGYNGAACQAHQGQITYVTGRHSREAFEVLLDEQMEFGSWDNGYYCLQIGTTHDAREGDGRLWWLVLRRRVSDAENGDDIVAFERVGMGYKHVWPINFTPCKLFPDADEEVVRLV